MLIIAGSGLEKTNLLLNLMRNQDCDNFIDKIYLCAKVLNKTKYQFLIKRRENVGRKHLHDAKAFIEYSATIDVVYNNIDDYNPNRNRKSLVVFDDMIADISTNKKFQSIIKELFIRCKKLNVSLAFFTQSYFPKEVRPKSD